MEEIRIEHPIIESISFETYRVHKFKEVEGVKKYVIRNGIGGEIYNFSCNLHPPELKLIGMSLVKVVPIKIDSTDNDIIEIFINFQNLTISV